VILHAGLITPPQPRDWPGVLIGGASGAGKSDLMLRLMEAGWRLVADDRTLVWVSQGRLFGRAPAPLAGLIEARGLGVVATPYRDFAEIVLSVRCVSPEAVERTPPERRVAVLGVDLPRLELPGLEASAPAKVARALTHLGL
jgi:serine kinase of HPr protein (carbohydrate metabolism regulator)